MNDLLQFVFSGFGKGLRDAVLGIYGVYDIDRSLSETAEPKQESPRKTVLAQKREARQKHKEHRNTSQPKVRHRILVCCAWNGGVFWMSILMFNGAILPCLKYITSLISGDSRTHGVIWSYIGLSITWIFNGLWILPLFILSKIVNGLWFQDIADAAYRKSRGRPRLPNLSKLIADILFSLILQALFLIQGMLATLLPLPGLSDLISLLHMCLLYSLYAFEYKWLNMGFGLPLVLLTNLTSSYIIGGCVFSILFPLFIISANEALPVRDTS